MFKFKKNICGFNKNYYDLLLNFRQKNRLENLVSSSSSEPKYASTSSALLTNQTDINNYQFSKPTSKVTSKVKYGFKLFLDECKKLREEQSKTFVMNDENFKIRDLRHTIDMLFTFENEDSLSNFIVSTDSSNNAGYSSASLKITQDKTALFSGHICTEIPKTGDIDDTGFANMMSLRKTKSFFRLSHYDWRYYNHLVLKIRGDGRKYAIVLPTPGGYDELKYLVHTHPLYTRGGPYWQLVKIPFSHFFCLNKGRAVQFQSPIALNTVTKFGITISDRIDGPFKLEIDYVGLEKVPVGKLASPYETYYVGKNYA